jgi:hypothetical protein
LGVFLKNVLARWTKTRKIKKVTTSQDDGLVGVLKKNFPRKLALMMGCAHLFWPMYPDFLHEARAR